MLGRHSSDTWETGMKKYYLRASSLVLGVSLGLALLEFISVFLSVSSRSVSKLRVGDELEDMSERGVREGLDGLEVATS